jgi:molecular chaperone HscB
MATQNYFQLFDLETKYVIDKKQLDQKLFEKQAKFHPDNHIFSPSLQNNLEKSQELNLAYKVLKSDFMRAEYILILNGFDINIQELDQDFLMETFEWREQLNDYELLPELKLEIVKNIDKTMLSLGHSLEKELYEPAKNEYIRLKFLKRFLEEIEKALVK